MKKFLEELYWIRNEETATDLSSNKDLIYATNTFCKCEEILCKRLKGENHKLFLQAVNAIDVMTASIAIDQFIDGAKMGARLMIEILKQDE